MIEVTSAIRYAREYAADLLKGEDYENIKLEEVIFSEESNEWHITLGYDSYINVEIEEPPYKLSQGSLLAARNVFADRFTQKTVRVYKIFRIDAENGNFKGMLIREVG
ncbi:hypothetical protein [Psychrobacter celer]|uniref:hypothetical protein n=1 Tax=Psychrobacter celer TaxID=306572 RepID=UPI003FCFADF0